MKLFKLILGFFGLLLSFSMPLSQADEPTDLQAERLVYSDKEARVLHQLLKMERHELTRLRETIERIEKMSPEEKTILSKRIHKIRQMPREQLEAMRQNFNAIPKETREAMRARWMEMNPAERAKLRARLKEMTPKERQATFEEDGVLPPLRPRHREGFQPETKETVVE